MLKNLFRYREFLLKKILISQSLLQKSQSFFITFLKFHNLDKFFKHCSHVAFICVFGDTSVLMASMPGYESFLPTEGRPRASSLQMPLSFSEENSRKLTPSEIQENMYFYFENLPWRKNARETLNVFLTMQLNSLSPMKGTTVEETALNITNLLSSKNKSNTFCDELKDLLPEFTKILQMPTDSVAEQVVAEMWQKEKSLETKTLIMEHLYEFKDLITPLLEIDNLFLKGEQPYPGKILDEIEDGGLILGKKQNASPKKIMKGMRKTYTEQILKISENFSVPFYQFIYDLSLFYDENFNLQKEIDQKISDLNKIISDPKNIVKYKHLVPVFEVLEKAGTIMEKRKNTFKYLQAVNLLNNAAEQSVLKRAHIPENRFDRAAHINNLNQFHVKMNEYLGEAREIFKDIKVPFTDYPNAYFTAQIEYFKKSNVLKKNVAVVQKKASSSSSYEEFMKNIDKSQRLWIR